MRRIIASVNTTLDGYMEGPNGEGDLGWLMPFVPDGIADNARLLGEETDAILLGRGTYQGFSGFWPTQEGEFADLMNLPPKYVFAGEGALQETPWGSYGNAHLVDRDVEARVRAMKAEDGGDMAILASGGLVSSFLGLGLVDELRIAVCPVVLGAGKRYLRGVDRLVELELAGSKPYPSGSVLLTYRVLS
jgi:dihydrofolate reductase